MLKCIVLIRFHKPNRFFFIRQDFMGTTTIIITVSTIIFKIASKHGKRRKKIVEAIFQKTLSIATNRVSITMLNTLLVLSNQSSPPPSPVVLGKSILLDFIYGDHKSLFSRKISAVSYDLSFIGKK